MAKLITGMPTTIMLTNLQGLILIGLPKLTWKIKDLQTVLKIYLQRTYKFGHGINTSLLELLSKTLKRDTCITQR